MRKILSRSLIVLAGFILCVDDVALEAGKGTVEKIETQSSAHQAWPVLKRYDQDHIGKIALPLGGIGTGTVSLGGRGDLRDWEIMNRGALGFVPTKERFGPFFAIFIQTTDSEPFSGWWQG